HFHSFKYGGYSGRVLSCAEKRRREMADGSGNAGGVRGPSIQGEFSMNLTTTRRDFVQMASLLLASEAIAQTIPPGQIVTLCGSGVRGVAADGDDALTAKLNNPYGMTEKSDRASLYFVENQSHRIVRYERSTKKIHLVAGTAVKGSAG